MVFIALPTLAKGLIPCGGVGEPECGSCELLQLINNLIEFLVQLAILVAGVIFAWGGFKMVISAGESGSISEARGMMTNAVVGIVIVLCAWLAVDTLMKMLLKEQVIGVWNEIQCTVPSAYRPLPGTSVVVSGEPTYTDSDLAARVKATQQYRDQLCAEASKHGVGEQCDTLQALMAIESRGSANAVSSKGSIGLMQIEVGTAKGLDPSLNTLTDAQIREKLKDPTYNIQLGVKNYANLYKEYGGDVTKALAAYNGGRGANAPSENCPGKTKWECEWDNDEHTDANEGYAETRNYVVNIQAAASQI